MLLFIQLVCLVSLSLFISYLTGVSSTRLPPYTWRDSGVFLAFSLYFYGPFLYNVTFEVEVWSPGMPFIDKHSNFRITLLCFFSPPTRATIGSDIRTRNFCWWFMCLQRMEVFTVLSPFTWSGLKYLAKGLFSLSIDNGSPTEWLSFCKSSFPKNKWAYIASCKSLHLPNELWLKGIKKPLVCQLNEKAQL